MSYSVIPSGPVPSLTEEQIEVRVMRFFDTLDARFMRGAISQEQYDEGVRDIDGWSQVAYNMMHRREQED